MAKIIVGVGEGAVALRPEDEIVTYALGSCVAVILLDPKTRIVGIVHVALPDSSINPAKAQAAPYYFADTAIKHLLDDMNEKGSLAHPGYIVKIAGGAKVIDASSNFDIGLRNINAVKKELWKYNFIIKAEDVGKDFSRTVHVSLSDGKVWIVAADRQKWSI